MMNYDQETIIEKNITLSFEFERYLQENPRLLAQIPEDAEVVLLPKDAPELYRINYDNYTEEREALFADLTMDDIVAEIKRKQK